jgi:hypothetical protein
VKKCVLFVLLSTVTLGAWGQTGVVGGDILFDLVGSARSAALGGAGLALPGDDALFLNPAGLAWVEGVRVLSAYGSQYGAADVGLLGLAVPGLAAAGIVLDAGAIGPDLSFRTEGAALGAGVRLGPLAAGASARIVRPVAPTPGLGGALDLALLWQGPLHVGAVVRSVLSQAPVAGEAWPPELAVGLAVPLDLGHWRIGLALDARDVLVDPTISLGAELGLEWLLVRAGYGPGGWAFGGSVRWALFQLEWAIVVHPVLSPAFRVSLTVIF